MPLNDLGFVCCQINGCRGVGEKKFDTRNNTGRGVYIECICTMHYQRLKKNKNRFLHCGQQGRSQKIASDSVLIQPFQRLRQFKQAGSFKSTNQYQGQHIKVNVKQQIQEQTHEGQTIKVKA